MSEGGPLLEGAAKAQRETANTDTQHVFLTEIVVDWGLRQLRESHVKTLQQIAVDEIYLCGGVYRDVRWKVRITDSMHEPPEAAAVPDFVREACDVVNNPSTTLSAVERAAYALWRFNWIHPFRGGNGRTARAIAYLIVCMDLGFMIPGGPTVPRQIAARRDEYLKALRAADASVPDPHDGKAVPDLSVMSAFLFELVEKQLEAAIEDARSGFGPG